MKRPASPIHALPLPCPTCAEETPHRVLHVSAYREGGYLAGVARCGKCRQTHPFEVRPATGTVRVVLSKGARSRMVRVPRGAFPNFEPGTRFTIEDGQAHITRIEPEGPPSPEDAGKAFTVWAVAEGPARVRVSLSAGARTIPLTVELDPDTPLRVAGNLVVGSRRLRIYAIRVGRRTIDDEGFTAPAGRIVRVYARSAWTPPPGNNA